jgi:hypothetical protein
VVSTSSVRTKTTLLLARFRYRLQIARADAETILVEEIVPLACTGLGDEPQWLAPQDGECLLSARPDRNLAATAIEQQIGILLAALPKFQQALDPVAGQRAAAQLAAHERVREAVRNRGRVTIEPVLPVDILGAYVLLPRLS